MLPVFTKTQTHRKKKEYKKNWINQKLSFTPAPGNSAAKIRSEKYNNRCGPEEQRRED